MRRSGAVRRAVVIGVALGVLAPGTVPAGDAASGGRVIRFENDTLTVRLASVPVTDVLDELTKQTGAEVTGPLIDPREVSAEFDAVPLPQALARLLGDTNFALVYGEGGRLRALKFLPAGPATARPPAVAMATPPTTVPQAQPITLEEFIALLAQQPPIKVDGALAAAIGEPNATYQQIGDIALSHDNAGVRMAAIGTILRSIEGQPDLRTKLVSVAAGMDPEQLSAIIENTAGPRAHELASNVTGQTRATEVRAKFSAALQRLRRRSAPPSDT